MSTQGLATAVSAVLADVQPSWAASPVPVHDTDATGEQTLPWVLFSVGLPDVSERSLAHRVHARHGRVLAKAVAGTAHGARDIGDEVDARLEGVTFVVVGWTLGPLGLLNVRDPEADREVVTTNGVHPIVQVLEYRFTAIRTA